MCDFREKCLELLYTVMNPVNIYIAAYMYIFVTFAITSRAEKVLCRAASVCCTVMLCVCVCLSAELRLHARCISLGGEGNVLYPVLSSYCCY